MPKKGGLREKLEAERVYRKGMATFLDLIAPAAFSVRPNYIMLNDWYVRTFFVFTYPRYLFTNWLSPIINFDVTMDISMFIYPLESKAAMTELRRKVTELESTWQIEREKGLVRSPELETAIGDIEVLREQLQKGETRLFQFALYFTIYAKTLEDLEVLSKQLESILGGFLIYTKSAILQMEQGFNSCLPFGLDQLHVVRNMDTGSLSTVFPFTSTSLTSNEGILYGLNRHNNSLIIFDRFKLENANMVVFAKSGAGKSYAVKLQILRELMWNRDIIVIDPEDEYKSLCEAVGGTYIPISLRSDKKMNPFDLPRVYDVEEGETDALRSAIINLHGLISMMVGGLTPEEDTLLDKALFETYALRDITTDPKTQDNPPPLMEDLYSVLQNMRGAESIAARLQKYVEGSFAEIFNRPTNFDMKEGFIVFSIRDLEDQLRPLAMYMIVSYIWNKVRMKKKHRILVVDEAWWLLQYEDSARFLFGLAKRGRKYNLGLTTITQDVEDVLGSKFGKAIVTNSSLQLLMKQSTAAIDLLADVFNLTEGEKFLLLNADVGEGLFFAGLNHVAIKIISSYWEDQVITAEARKLLKGN
jgi:type IV secretory pathway VirB4 component